jgi:hypothetical protein
MALGLFNGIYPRREQIGLFKKQKYEKPQRGDINIAWGIAPGNQNYAHVEYNPYKSYQKPTSKQ